MRKKKKAKSGNETALSGEDKGRYTDLGIGTYNERSLHAALKRYIEPDESFHEIKYKGCIADIKNSAGITEVQTGSFAYMRKKLDIFLSEDKVTVVYPCVRKKWLIWVDPETGEATSRRRSPKTGTEYNALKELFQIRSYIFSENLTVRIIMVDVEEYRKLNGWSKDKKRGSERCERVPVGIYDEYILKNPDDYRIFIPEGLPAEFTVKEYSALTKTAPFLANTAVNTLVSLGLFEESGKRKRARLFRIPE